MRKRLRKKKRLREFTEFLVDLDVTLRRGSNFDSFLDAFVDDAIEANEMYCGFGGKETQLSGCLELGRIDVCPRNRKRVEEWLKQRPDVESYQFGEIFDAWKP